MAFIHSFSKIPAQHFADLVLGSVVGGEFRRNEPCVDSAVERDVARDVDVRCNPCVVDLHIDVDDRRPGAAADAIVGNRTIGPSRRPCRFCIGDRAAPVANRAAIVAIAMFRSAAIDL